MSSSQAFIPSSPLSATTDRRRKSRFTYKQLAQLASYSTTCPLRVIAHIDLDAFYAQCEMVRLDVPEDQPLAVRQWDGLIAVNYPARKFGLTRFINIEEAKKLCPNLILQHVATWKEGEDQWAYRDVLPNIGTHKVSLDPYREQSRRILACIKEALPANLQKVEKASIDEVFLDLSAHIHSLLLERYPELRLPAPYDDQTENLPLPSTTALDWQTDALVDLDAEQAEEDDPDWDDITMFIGSELVRHVRGAVREQLKYTMSAGVAQNKMLSKLGSAHRKPNQQTVIRNRAVQHFLSDFKFTKIRNLGGKLGEQVVATFGTDLVKDLLPIGIEVLKQKLGDETGTWLYQTVRGIDTSEVNPRTQIKSMLSAKSFRPSINSFEQAARWLQIFVCDIYSRLVEAGVLEHKRRPKTLTLHHRRGGQVTQDISRQGPIHQAKVITEASLLELAKKLMNQIIQEGNAWPCINLSLSVGGFEDAVKGNMGIDSFLVTGEQARAMKVSMREAPQDVPSNGREKRPRRDVGPQGVLRFFKTTSVDEENDESNDIEAGNGMAGGVEPPNDAQRNDAGYLAQAGDANTGGSNLHQQQLETYFCPSCNRSFDSEAELQSHQDWHFAKSLQEEERNQTRNSPIPQSRLSSGKKRGSGTAGRTTKGAGHAKHDKGQSKLSFK